MAGRQTPRWLQLAWSNPKARAGLLITLGFVVMSLLGPFVVQDPMSFVAVPHSPPSFEHLLGTTGQGQDVLAQVVVGSRVTLLVSFVVGFFVVLVGAVIGGTAAFFGGWVDEVLSLMTNVFLVIPGLPLMVVIAAWVPTGNLTMMAVLVLTGWAWGRASFGRRFL